LEGSGQLHDAVETGIRFLRLAARGRTTGAVPDNLPPFSLGHGISQKWRIPVYEFVLLPIERADLRK
jgi:hypothetical protein